MVASGFQGSCTPLVVLIIPELRLNPEFEFSILAFQIPSFFLSILALQSSTKGCYKNSNPVYSQDYC